MPSMTRERLRENAPLSGDFGSDRGAPKAPAAHPGAVLQRMAEGGSVGPSGVMGLQSSIGNRATRRLLRGGAPIQRKDGGKGLPEGLKAGVESLSGMSMDDVSVHYNSDKPAQARSRAYTQGSEIHVGPGQEASLAHEAWHVVQQKQGRVTPTLQYKGMEINTDSTLETEADVMGAKAQSLSPVASRFPSASDSLKSAGALGQTVQRKAVRQFHSFSSSAEVQQDPDFDELTMREIGRHKDYDRVLNPNRKQQAMLANAAETGADDVSEIDVATSGTRKKWKDFQRSKHGKGAFIELAKRQIQTYRITDDNFHFYTAKAKAHKKNIVKHGLDPARGGVKNLNDVNNPSEYMSRGHLYFCTHPDDCEVYASRFGLGDGKYTIFEFTLPVGAEFTVDPEWDGGFRTTRFIEPDNLRVFR